MIQINSNTNINALDNEAVKGLLLNNSDEDIYFDFKEGIDGDTNDDKHNIRKTMVSFANTIGGFIFFGVLDKQNRYKKEGLDRVVGLKDVTELGKRITQKYLDRGYCIPIINFEGPQIIDYDGKNVAVIKIPQSDKRPHAILWSIDKPLEFWARGSGTARPMDYSYLLSEIDRSKEARGWLSALYYDLREIIYISEANILHEDADNILPNRFDSIICNEIGSILRVLATDTFLINHILEIRHELVMANDVAGMAHSKASLPLTGLAQILKNYNRDLSARSKSIKSNAKIIKAYLLEHYQIIRELSALEQNNRGST